MVNSVIQVGECHLSKLLEAMRTLRARNPGLGLVVKRGEMKKKELSLLLENTYHNRGLNSYFIIIINMANTKPAKTVPESDSNK